MSPPVKPSTSLRQRAAQGLRLFRAGVFVERGFYVVILDDTDEAHRILAVRGPYSSR